MQFGKTIVSLPTAILLSVANLHADSSAPSAESAGKSLTNSTRHGEFVDIELKEGKLKTWVVYPERSDKAPVVIVVHEIFGLSEWARAVTDELAANGYIALAPDLLSGKGPDGGGTESFKGQGIGEAIRKITAEEYTTKIDAVREYALKLPAAGNKSATIGFCWGGAAVFEYATRQPGIDATFVYYGTAPKETKSFSKITGPVFGYYGGDDARVTATVEPTSTAMKESGKTYTPVIYQGAGHGFLRQQTGREGNQSAASEAWKSTLVNMKAVLQPATK